MDLERCDVTNLYWYLFMCVCARVYVCVRVAQGENAPLLNFKKAFWSFERELLALELVVM